MVAQITDVGITWLTEARRITPENEEITLAVMELVEAWQAGSLPLWGVTNQCTGWERFIALNHIKAGTPEREALKALFDAICEQQDIEERAWQTKHGRFTAQDMADHGGKVVRGVIHWPEWGSHERGFHYREDS